MRKSLRLKYYAMYAPISYYFLLFVGACLAAWYLLPSWAKTSEILEFRLLWLIGSSLAKLATAVVALALLSIAIPYLFFAYYFKSGRTIIEISNNSSSGEAGRTISLKVAPILKPFLGFIYYRLVYDTDKVSPKFRLSPIETVRGQNRVQQGLYHWPLPAIRLYDVEKMLVYFEDLFHFFSLTVRVPIQQSFFTNPRKTEVEQVQVAPGNTIEQQIRIEEIKKVAGDFVQFKNFEQSDDIRRIAWKFYARNRALMVRIPEKQDPTASHINMHLSFLDGFSLENNYHINTRALDYYKNLCWSLYLQFIEHGNQVKMFFDQPLPGHPIASEKTAYELAASRWQPDTEGYELPNLASSNLICIHSLCTVQFIQKFGAQISRRTPIVLILLSQSYPKPVIKRLVEWVFLMPENNYERQGFTDLGRSNVRKRIIQQEERLKQALKKLPNPYYII